MQDIPSLMNCQMMMEHQNNMKKIILWFFTLFYLLIYFGGVSYIISLLIKVYKYGGVNFLLVESYLLGFLMVYLLIGIIPLVIIYLFRKRNRNK
jgi:hypothetical protein